MRLHLCNCFNATFAAADSPSGASAPQSGGPVERSVFEDLAIGSRICAAENVFDAFGHLSVRHPTAPDRFFMTKSMAPALATADDIVELDLE